MLSTKAWRRFPGSQDAWELVGVGQTNADGRVPDLLPPAAEVAPGAYRLGLLVKSAGLQMWLVVMCRTLSTQVSDTRGQKGA